MRKLTAALMASAMAVSITVPAHANNLERLGVGVLMYGIGKAIEGAQNRQTQPRERQTQPQQRQAAPVRTQSAAPSRPARVPDENVRFVQQQLNDLGYTEVGGADGFWGPNSARGLTLFMEDNDMEGEPSVTPEIIAAVAQAKTRQEIADAREAAAADEAYAESYLSEAQVEDGIVFFGPVPDPDDLRVGGEIVTVEEPDVVGGEDVTVVEDTKTASDIEAAPTVHEVVAEEKQESETKAAETMVPETEAPSRDAAVMDETVADAGQESEVVEHDVVDEPQETAANGGAQAINGLTVSGDF